MENWIKYIAMGMFFLTSCAKDFLEVKSDVSIGTPHSIADYQALLDNSTSIMNLNMSHILGMIGADEYHLEEQTWNAYNVQWHKNAYIWAEDVFEGAASDDWNKGYEKIMYCNLILEGLDRISPSVKALEAWNNAKGSALFFRAYNFYQLAQLFTPVYRAATAAGEAGLPLRLESDVTLKSRRATVAETYEQILDDLENAISLLPLRSSGKMRPSGLAGMALLTRIHMQMENYDSALGYANAFLGEQRELIDFNSLTISSANPFTSDFGESNVEVIFFSYIPGITGFLGRNVLHAATDLLNDYEESDLRKAAFFAVGPAGNVYFKGSYFGATQFFVGLSTAEVLVSRAECYARAGNVGPALQDLNYLRKARYERDEFAEIGEGDPEKILEMTIRERRKELAFKGSRWEDLRRLNKDIRFQKDIARRINGKEYVLRYNDVKYVWPIPKEVIERSGIEQNIR